jgi:hypothetical protein
MLLTDLEEKLILAFKNIPIDIGGHVGTATLAFPKASEFAKFVTQILKECAGAPYKNGETEEITFGEGKNYFLVLTDK